MSCPSPRTPLLRICNVPVSVPIWECIRQMKCVFPLYESDTSDRNGCFEVLLLLCEHHFDTVIEYETTLYCEIRSAAERIVGQYFRWNRASLVSTRVMRDYCPRQLLMVLLWITPQGDMLAHAWIKCALCTFFNSRPLDRAQLLWIARFLMGMTAISTPQLKTTRCLVSTRLTVASFGASLCLMSFLCPVTRRVLSLVDREWMICPMERPFLLRQA